MPSPLDGIINLNATIGVGYIGALLSAAAYGVTCVQTFYYFRSTSSARDTWRGIKLLVTVLWALDTVHQFLVSHVLYFYLISNYANPEALEENVWSASTEIVFNAIIAFIVESFLLFRLWHMSGNKLVTMICGTFVIAHLTMNLLYPIRGYFFSNIEVALGKLQATGSSGLAVAVVTDVLLAGSLCAYLHKSRTGFQKSDDLITKLIALTITTGLLTTIFVIGDLIAYLIVPHDLVVLAFNCMLAKLYINSLLTSLNARNLIRGTSNEMNSIPLSNFKANSQAGVEINIHSTTDMTGTYVTQESKPEGLY